MRLTIKNYEKIIGEWSNITIVEVLEGIYAYRFRCHSPGSPSLDYWVTLSRNRMNNLANIYAFPFLSEDGQETQGITTDWFADMDNAVEVITQEFQTIYNEHNH